LQYSADVSKTLKSSLKMRSFLICMVTNKTSLWFMFVLN